MLVVRNKAGFSMVYSLEAPSASCAAASLLGQYHWAEHAQHSSVVRQITRALTLFFCPCSNRNSPIPEIAPANIMSKPSHLAVALLLSLAAVGGMGSTPLSMQLFELLWDSAVLKEALPGEEQLGLVF